MRFWSLINQYSQTLKSVGSIVVNDLEYLPHFSQIVMKRGLCILCLLSFFVLFFAILGFQRIIRMLFDLFLDDILNQPVQVS